MRLSTTTCTIERTSTRTWMTQNKLRRGFEVRWSKITIPREFANASWPDPLPRRTEHDPLPCRRTFAFISRAALFFPVSSLSMILQRLAVVSKTSCSWPNVVTKLSGETRSSSCRFRSLPPTKDVVPNVRRPATTHHGTVARPALDLTTPPRRVHNQIAPRVGLGTKRVSRQFHFYARQP